MVTTRFSGSSKSTERLGTLYDQPEVENPTWRPSNRNYLYLGSGLEAAIFGFPLSVWLNNILISLCGLLDPENVGLAVEISFLSHLQAEIKVVPVWRPQSWMFHFRYSILRSSLGLLYLENVGLAIEISFLSHQLAEIKVVPVWSSDVLLKKRWVYAGIQGDCWEMDIRMCILYGSIQSRGYTRL